jgi:DNA invertase Pin-like site-specific DNA recombinase
VGTLIIDGDGIYDPRLANDRLLLGMKGTFSEMELATLRQRSLEARRQKAARGEFYSLIPVGYVLTADNRLEMDPEPRELTPSRLFRGRAVGRILCQANPSATGRRVR